MKQLVQESGSGEVRLADVAAPVVRAGGILVRNHYSVISVGTDRMQLEFGRKSLVGKVMERPKQARRVVESAVKDGIGTTYRRVQDRLARLNPLGYSCAGVVEAVGPGVTEFEPGQRVTCAGARYAHHAELVWIPRNLAVPVPSGVSLEEAAFATMGAIALQGVRQADVRLGETVAVVGLGLLGQLTVRILRAAGTRVVAVDLDAERVDLAKRGGALGLLRSDAVEERIRDYTGGIGADAVILTAATSSDDPVQLAGAVARDRARVVVVGAVPMNIPRSPYYEKELDVRLSRSYGPGRYDPSFEEKGHDYPVGYVRWTERANMAEFVRLLEDGTFGLDALVTERVDLEAAAELYGRLGSGEASPLGVVVRYAAADAAPGTVPPVADRVQVSSAAAVRPPRAGRIGLGVIGAGSFAMDVLLPALSGLDVEPMGVVTAGGLSGRNAAERHGFRYSASSPDALLADDMVDAVVIATRHADHADLAAAALRAGKAVFVEKPLAISRAGLDRVLAAATDGPPLMVGFNRRFAPATQFLKEKVTSRPGAKVVLIRVNAGRIPADSWIHDPEEGGGRLIGEGCHFVDLAMHLVGAGAPESVEAVAIGGADPDANLKDNFAITLRFPDGSLGVITYTSKGDPGAGKERVEAFAGGATGVIDDFRRADAWLGGRRESWKGKQDKGHAAEMDAFVRCVRDQTTSPIPLAELEAVSRATLEAAERIGAAPAATMPAGAANDTTDIETETMYEETSG